MALLDVVTPRFAVPRSEAQAALKRMVRAFFAPAHWAEGERQVDERFGRGDTAGYAEGETGGPYDEQPSTIAWKVCETMRDLLWVEVSSRQFGGHLVDMITMEHQVGRKVQPFPHGFRLEQPLPLGEFGERLAGALGHPMDLTAHLAWRAKRRFCLELFGGFQAKKEAPAYHDWVQASLPAGVQARLRAAHRFVWSHRRAAEVIDRMRLTPAAMVAGVAGLLQEGSGMGPADALPLTVELLDHFPADLDWQMPVYDPLRIPIEQDRLEVDFAYPFGVRSGLPYVPEGRSAGPAEIILHPESSNPVLHGLYDRQCLVLDAVDELRRAFGLPPDARYDHYRSNALRDE